MNNNKQGFFDRLNNINVGKPGTVLVFHADGYNLHGALVHAGLSGQQVQAAASSAAIDCHNAVAEVAARLKQQGIKKLPRKVALVTSSAISALVELPVKADSPRTSGQMQELVRWELEPLYARQNEQWRIGGMLMGRGHLDQQQRQNVAEEYATQNMQHGGHWSTRFGELAVDMGYVTQEQIEECLTLQERLVNLDDEIVCGWSPQEGEDDPDIDAIQTPWLVAGVGRDYLQSWAKAFRRNSMTLEWIYPALGAGFANLEIQAGSDVIYVDVGQEQMTVMHGRPGAVSNVRTEMLSEGRVLAEQIAGFCRDESGADTGKVYLNGSGSLLSELQHTLAPLLPQEVILLAEAGGV